MNMRKFKAGDFVKILADKEHIIDRVGTVVKIEKYNCMWDGQHCWLVVHEDGKRNSLSEMYLEPCDPPAPITLEQVIAAKNVVDKAQKMFVELLSKYQLQEASK